MNHIVNRFLFNGLKEEKCMVFLNTDMNRELFKYLWRTTAFHVTADGAANHLFDMFPEAREQYIPDYIIVCAVCDCQDQGDFDSLHSNVLDYYQAHGSRVLKDPNQDNTDLDKCLLHLHELSADRSVMNVPSDRLHVLVYGDLGGRFDHAFGILNSLMLAYPFFKDLVLVGPKSTMRILPPGVNQIERCSEFQSGDGDICGIIPLGGVVCEHVTTTGLKWNLNDSRMQFGELVSSSNCMLFDSATVSAPCHLVWTLSTKWEV